MLLSSNYIFIVYKCYYFLFDDIVDTYDDDIVDTYDDDIENIIEFEIDVDVVEL